MTVTELESATNGPWICEREHRHATFAEALACEALECDQPMVGESDVGSLSRSLPPLPDPPAFCPMCQAPRLSKGYRHSVYCAFYRPYGTALASICFEPGDPGYEEACALKARVGDSK
jgi:hypothetical protein